jgi:ABC-type sugar transport system ATPase subunit
MVIIGYSGTGKSVAIKHIVGLLEPDAGEVWVDNVRVDTLSRASSYKLRSKIGYVFQFAALFDSLSIGENVAMGLRKQGELTEGNRAARRGIARHRGPRRCGAALSGRTLRRHAQARGHCARGRAAPQVHPVRRTHHRSRSGHVGRHRRTHGAHARSARGHGHRDHARHAQRVSPWARASRCCTRARCARWARSRRFSTPPIPWCGSSSKGARRSNRPHERVGRRRAASTSTPSSRPWWSRRACHTVRRARTGRGGTECRACTGRGCAPGRRGPRGHP